jgi:hypothetical protein
MSYFVEWIGGVIPVALAVVLVAPWFPLIVLMVVLAVIVAVLVALAAAVVAAPYLLVRKVHRLWLARSTEEQPQALPMPLVLHTQES